jgi:hypothetical protein
LTLDDDDDDDLQWLQALMVLMNLGIIDKPCVPHNLISTQKSPCPFIKVPDGPQT